MKGNIALYNLSTYYLYYYFVQMRFVPLCICTPLSLDQVAIGIIKVRNRLVPLVTSQVISYS